MTEEQKNEYLDLLAWFDIYYTQHEQKLRRLHTLGQKTDDNKDPYIELLSLYAEAETKRARIRELEVLLGIS